MSSDTFSKLREVLPENLRRFRPLALELEPGIVVVLRGSNGRQSRLEAEVLDEIAAALTAIKIYVSTRNGRNGTRRSNVQRAAGPNGNGKNVAWFKTWLNEISREFDFNPYRKGGLEF